MRGRQSGEILVCQIPHFFNQFRDSLRFPRNLIQLQRDDIGTKELSRSIRKYIIYSLSTLSGMGTPMGEGNIAIYSVVHLIPYLIYGVAGM